MKNLILIGLIIIFPILSFGQVEGYEKLPTFEMKMEPSVMHQKRMMEIQKDFFLLDGASKIAKGTNYILVGVIIGSIGSAAYGYGSDEIRSAGFVTAVIGLVSNIIGIFHIQSGTQSLKKGHTLNNVYLQNL